jgi:hypothetical protein
MVAKGAQVEELDDQHMMSVIALRQVEDVTGHHIILKPGEKVTNMQVTPDLVTVVIRVVDAREVSMGFQVRRVGMRLYAFQLKDNTWMGQPPMTAWDEDFEPQFLRGYGQGPNLAEWLDRLWFARECGRPGTARNPLDSFQRTTDGVGNEAMKRYYKLDTIGEETERDA